MLWWMIPTGSNQEIPVLGTQTVVFNCARGDKSVAVAFCTRNKLGSKRADGSPVHYKLIPLADNGNDNDCILCTQVILPPKVDSQAVAAAIGLPHGQRNSERAEGPIDPNSKFQQLSDRDLPLDMSDNMFGEVDDGTYTDLMQIGGGFTEHPRIMPKE